ncbi:hypothetical protein BsWGS_26666 [Bradybaena similaris]
MDTHLHTAVRYANVHAVLEALMSGISPNVIGLFKWSPVHEAANNGERDILKLLVDYGGDVNLPDKLHGNTPLHYAAREDNSACVTVLLKAGARIDIKNFEGMTCLDEATPLCQEIIHKFVNSRTVGSDWNGERNGPMESRNMSINGSQMQNEWDHLPTVPEQAAIGQLHLSFEYNKVNLKIRVWQVSDLLLPPPQISMIDSIFVRSYLVPDPVKKTSRQTEAVRVESQSKDSTMPPHSGIQHIFSSSSFRFETPLLYTGVTQDIVTTRSVQLEVCMSQKHTRKVFLMGLVNMPLRVAVKHPIREKYPLIPCMNHTIPNSMRVYSARDIIFDYSSSSQEQSLSRSESMHSSYSCPADTKDMYLGNVEHYLRRTSIELTDSDCDDGVGSSIDIISTLGKSRTSSAGTVDAASIGAGSEEASSLREATGLQSDIHPTATGDVNYKEHPKPKKKIIPYELMDKVSVSEIDLERVHKEDATAVTIIKQEDDIKSHVVTAPADKGDMAVSPDSGILPETILKNPPTGKKKIIPPELLSIVDVSREEEPQSGNQNSNQADTEHQAGDTSCVYDDIQSSHKGKLEGSHPALQDTGKMICETPSESSNKLDESLEEQHDITLEINHSRQSSSIETPDTSSTPVSRPETPIWDFYDFTLEEGVKNDPETEASSSNDAASLALGTLQQSILRLSQATKVLDTCRVTGPVLPTIMIEDFEMDEEDDDVSGDDENVES